MAFRFLHGSEIRDDFGRFHHDFAQDQRSRTDDLGGDPHDPYHRVDLRKVPAVRSQRLPDIRRRIEPDDVNTVVAQIQHIRRHIVEDHRIAVIQVPLIRIERRHDDFPGFFAVCEISGSRGGKDLRHRLLELFRYLPVVKEEISVLIFLLPRSRAFCPLVILARVIHHKIKADADAAAVAFLRKVSEILHGPQFRLHLPEIRHRIAAVAPSFRTLKKRHEVHVIRAAFLDIVKVFLHAFEIPGKALHIHDHAEHLVAGIPLRIEAPRLVPLPETLFPFFERSVKHLQKIGKRLFIVRIEFSVKPLHLIIIRFQPFQEYRIKCLVHLSLRDPFEIFSPFRPNTLFRRISF